MNLARPAGSSRRLSSGFTMIELIVVMTIVAVLAAIAIPRLAAPGARRLRRASHQLATHIKLARDLAMATSRHTWVVFDLSGDSYSVYIEDPDNPGRSHRISVTHPETGGDFDVALNTGDFAGVEFGGHFGGEVELEFDSLGRPYNGTTGTLLPRDVGILLQAGSTTRTVRVVAQTGMVEEVD